MFQNAIASLQFNYSDVYFIQFIKIKYSYSRAPNSWLTIEKSKEGITTTKLVMYFRPSIVRKLKN